MDYLPLFPTLVVGAGSLLVWYAVSRWNQRKQYPPGPMPYPVIGNLNYVMNSTKKQWITITELQKKYGDIFTLFFANQPTVILGTLDLIREAYLTNQNDFAGRPSSYSFEMFSKGYKDIVFGQFGPVWKRQRKIVHEAIRKFAQGDCLADLINESTRKAFAEMDKEADTGKRFNPRHSLNMVIYNIIASMVFGKTFEHNDPFLKHFIEVADEANEGFGSGLLADLWPIFKYLPTSGQRVVKKSVDEMFGLIEGTYAEHEKNFDEKNLKDFVDYMLQSRKDAERDEGIKATEGLTRDHYMMNIMDVFSAGTDTSRFTLTWAVLFLAVCPEVQKKLQDEVDSVVELEDPLCIEHRAHLPYAEAFLHEVMRIRPLLPLSLPHMTTCDTTVGGYKIPKGTQVMPNVWAVHMDPKHWEDPETFKPERFLSEDGKMGPRISSWLPFSTGRRVCVGEAVAKTELHLTLASLVRRYNFTAPPGVTMDTEAKTAIMLPPEYEVILTKRK